MGNDVSTFEAGSHSNTKVSVLDLGDGYGRWYQTDHFRARMQERLISRSSISRAIRSGRRKDVRDGAVKCTGDHAVVVLNEKHRVLITVYTVGEPAPEPVGEPEPEPVGKPEPEPVDGWGSMGAIAAMGLIGGVLFMAMAEARREEEEARRRRFF
jgi:Domain of unknown function (DUF4258)